MRQSFLVFLACLPCAALAQTAPAGIKEMIVTGGLSSGKTYQVAEQCGASAEMLKAYKARFDADTQGGEQLYASLGIHIEQVFLQGRKDGESFYAGIKSTPERDKICSQTLALVKSQGAGR
jgi:hypothetical protein